MSGDRTEVEAVQFRKVEMKETGKSITVRDAPHARSNHYILQSRPYFPKEKLRTYIDFPHLQRFIRLARGLCAASLFGALAAAGWSKFIPIFFLVACLLFFIIYCQHESVNQSSLPLVLRQPVFDSQRSGNSFYEVTVAELDGVALRNYQAGVGFIQLSQGKIEFQAIRYMSDAKCQSRLMLVLFSAAAVYNCYFIAAYS